MGERQFGPYRLVRQIAVGGMAEIHLAKARGIAGFEKYVALKMIHPNFSQDDQFIQMLIDEAKISVQLQHVNIAQTFDLGRVSDTYYITMEFVDGADLYKILRRGAEQDVDMPVDVAAYIAKEMATGLDYAHRKRDVTGRSMGIVHRDVSPQNVLISHAGEIKLVDFGIAKATMRARQTAVGVIKGKYYYMSPEQAWGDPVDHRSDVFSCGIVLYEMLTGQMLYLEEDLHKLLDMVRKANIAPPSRLRRDVPPQLERIVMHALQKRPDDRYQTAADLATDLERFLHVYSPVFTSPKVVQHCRRVLDDAPPPPPVAPPAPVDPGPSGRNPRMSTQPLERTQLVQARSEITDENSVIFRISELRAAAEQEAAPVAPAPAQPSSRRLADAATKPADSFADREEATMISSPPGFRASVGGFDTSLTDASGEIDDFEATVVERMPESGALDSGDADEEGPTITRDHNRAPQPTGDDGEEGSTTRSRPIRLPGQPPPAPPPRPPARPEHPALSASTPQPAVSELRGPRRTRRTPARGVPIEGRSILSAIVDRAPAEPAPTRPVKGRGPSSDGVPAPLAPGQSGLPQRHQLPQQHALPSNLPPAGPARDPAAPVPTGLPLGAPDRSEPVFGLPAGNESFTDQLRRLEVDEIPEAYKIGSGIRGRWLLRGALAIGCIALGVSLGLLITRDEGGPTRAAILIESIPSGAEIRVDGKLLAEKTPTIFDSARPGDEYALEVGLPGYTTWTKTVVVPAGRDEASVVAFLKQAGVNLRVQSRPPGAQVFIGGEARGRTPIELHNLDRDRTRSFRLELPGFEPETRTLDWSVRHELDFDIELERAD